MTENGKQLGRKLRANRGGRYAGDLRRCTSVYIYECRNAGVTWRTLHEELGLPKETLRRWREAAQAEMTKLQPVRTVPAPPPLETMPVSPSSATLVSPSGWRLEELDARVAVKLFGDLAL